MKGDVINLREHQFDDFTQKGTKFRATITEAIRVGAFYLKPSGITAAQMTKVRVLYNGRPESTAPGTSFERLQKARGKSDVATSGFLEIGYIRDFQKDPGGMLSTLLNIGGLYANPDGGTKVLEKVEIEIETSLTQGQADAASIELFATVTDHNASLVQQGIYRFVEETETTQKDLEDKFDLFLNPRENERFAISRLVIGEAVANIDKVKLEVNGRDWVETIPALNKIRGEGKAVYTADAFLYDTHIDGIEGTIPLAAMPLAAGNTGAKGEVVNKAELIINWAAGNRPNTFPLGIEYIGTL